MKKVFKLFSLLLVCVVFIGCASTSNLSDAGKEGPIQVSIGSHLTVSSIDFQPTKLRGSMKLESGYHAIELNYKKITSDYIATGYAKKAFLFEEGKSYTIKAIPDGNILFCPVREKGLEQIRDTVVTVKPLENPETNNGKEIKILSVYPEDRKYEIVGEFQMNIQGGVFATKSLTPDRAVLYLRELAADYDIDCFVDIWAAHLFDCTAANAIGIRYLDE